MEQTTCLMCNHQHKEPDGSCECGCKTDGAVCSQCAHTHSEPDGSCECGCGKA